MLKIVCNYQSRARDAQIPTNLARQGIGNLIVARNRRAPLRGGVPPTRNVSGLLGSARKRVVADGR